MSPKPSLLVLPLLVAATVGCGGPAPTVSASQTAAVQPQSALNAKLSGMSAQERAEYIRTHLSEVTAAAAAGQAPPKNAGTP